MIYTNQYYPGVVLNSSAEVQALQKEDPSPKNFFWVLSDLTADSDNVQLTNDYNSLDNLPNLPAYISVGVIDVNLPELTKDVDYIRTPSIRVAIRDNPDHRGEILAYNVGDKEFIVPRDGLNHFIYVDYNGGLPVYQMTNDSGPINNSDKVLTHVVWNITGDIHSIGLDNKGEGLANKIDNAILDTTPYRRALSGGLIITEQATRIINISEGIVYAGTVPQFVQTFNATNDRITEVFHTLGNWDFNILEPGGAYNNTHYDNGTDLVESGNNKYLVRWIYRSIGDDREIFLVYGHEHNTLAEAKNEPLPSVPEIVTYHCMLVGRVIVQHGATNGIAESAFGVSFSGSTVGIHNDLSGIQGGVPGDYQHISAVDRAYWNNYPNRTQNKLGVFRDPTTLTYEASLSYDQVARTLTLSANTTVYPSSLLGLPQTINAGIICTHPNTTGTYFIYVNSLGILTCSTSAWNLLVDCPIALIYYNATQVRGICFEERHAHDRNPEAHKQQHLSIGTFCSPCPDISSYTLQPASPNNTHNKYSVTSYTIYDEDIKIDQAALLTTSIKHSLYRGVGGVWNISDGSDLGYLAGTYIQYNPVSGGNWSLVDIDNNSFVNYYVFATTSTTTTHRIITIPSQEKYSTLSSAQAEAVATAFDITTLPLQEWVLLYKITYKTSAAYSSTGKCRIENVIKYAGARVETSISGSGISQAFADATYLRLDATNDPLGGELTVNADVVAQGFRDTTFTGSKPLASDASGNIVENVAYGYYVHTQTIGSTVWTITNPLGRICNVDLYDANGKQFMADVTFSVGFGTITVNMFHVKTGSAVLS